MGGAERDIRLEGPDCKGEVVCVCVERESERGEEEGVLGRVELRIKTIPSIHHWSRSGCQGNAATCGKNL